MADTPKPDLAFVPAPPKPIREMTADERRAYSQRIVEAARASIRAEWEAARAERGAKPDDEA